VRFVVNVCLQRSQPTRLQQEDFPELPAPMPAPAPVHVPSAWQQQQRTDNHSHITAIPLGGKKKGKVLLKFG